MSRFPHPLACRPKLLAALAVLILFVGGTACGQEPAPVAGTSTPAATTTTTSQQQASTPESTTTTTTKRCTPSQAIAAMPLRDRLAQLLMVGVGAGSADGALSVVRAEQVGGLFLTGDATGLLTGGSLRKVQEASPVPLLVAVDDEGGRVQRIADLAGSIPSAREMAATMTPEQVYELALRRGKALAERGVTMNLAPVVDVSSQPGDAVIGDRSFSADPEVVTKYAGAFARGMRDAGILPTFKHFPGHGRAEGDSHTGMVTTPPIDELAKVDLRPYRKLLDGDASAAVMLGHLDVPGLTKPGVPASLSPAAVDLLRQKFGFNGLVITDDLYAMDAIRGRYGLGEAARRALAAGVDMALMISADRLDPVLDHLESAVAEGSLPEARVNEAVAHVLTAKGVDPCDLR